MKLKNISIILTGLFLMSGSCFAIPVTAPVVEAKQDVIFFYTSIKDNYDRIKKEVQEQREIKQIIYWAEELEKLQTQILKLQKLYDTATSTYHKVESLVEFHGDWNDILTLDVVKNIKRKAEQKDNTVTSIFKDIDKAPQKVLDNSEFIQKYVAKLDETTWAQEVIHDRKTKLTPDMLAMQRYKQYSEYSDKIHGYRNDMGYQVHGTLEMLDTELEIAKRTMGTAKDEANYIAAMDTINQIELQIEYELDQEKLLMQRYEVSKSAADQGNSINDKIDDLRQEHIAQIDLEDKHFKYPTYKTVREFLSSQEEEAFL